MDFIESHFEESKQAIIGRVKESFSPIDSDQTKLEMLIKRLSNVSDAQLLELANERLKDFEEKLKNLGFGAIEADQHSEAYKERLVEFITEGLRKYLLNS